MFKKNSSVLVSAIAIGLLVLVLGISGTSAVAQDVVPAPTGDTLEAPPVVVEMPTTAPTTPAELPTAAPPAPTESPAEAPPAPTESPTGVLPTPTELLAETPTLSNTPPVEPTLAPTMTLAPLLIPEPPMRLLVRDLFDSGDLSHWLLGAGWAIVPSETGFALQANSPDAAKLNKGAYYNAAVQMRFALTGGTAKLSLRVSSAGRYTASLDASGALLLFRGDALLGSAAVAPTAPGTWRTLRLSAVNDTVRVMLDATEWIVAQDTAPLPPGEAEIMAGAAGANADGSPIIAPMLADEVFLFVPEAEYSLYPQPTDVPLPTLMPTEAPTTVPTLVPTIPPVTNALPVVIEAESSDVSRFGDWQEVVDASASGGRYLMGTEGSGAALEFFFRGAAVTVNFINGLTDSTVTLTLDDTPLRTWVSVRAPTSVIEPTSLTGLGAGAHKLRIEAPVGIPVVDSIRVIAAANPLASLTDTVGIASEVFSDLREDGTANVIVYFNTTASVGASVPDSVVAARIDASSDAIVEALPENQVDVNAQFQYIPALAAEITDNALVALQEDARVSAIQTDREVHVALAQSRTLMNVPAVETTYGLTGAGVNVAILDTGISASHSWLSDSVVAQRCFLSTGCPGGGTTGSNAADGQGHGTHVAGIITSNNATNRGVANGAGIVAVKILSDAGSGSWSDILKGLEWVYTNRATYNIRVINMSLGGGLYSGYCDASDAAGASVVNRLTSAGVAVFVASGNDGSSTQVSSPGCLQNAISIGAVYDSGASTGRVTSYSNGNSTLDLLAPGSYVTSSTPSGSATLEGTSMATPMAAGVAALLFQQNPNLTVAQLVAKMKSTGVSILDTRNGLTFPRINALAAAQNGTVVPTPTRTPTVTPSPTAPPTGVPALVSPVNGSTLNFVNRPTFSWGRVTGATKYELQVANNAAFTTPTTRSLTTTSATWSSNLAKGTYYWRVRAYVSKVWQSYSGVFSVTLSTPAPTLLTPSDNELQSLRPTFTWQRVTGATAYQIQRATNPNFTGAVVNSVTTATYTPTQNLASGTYYWRVRGQVGSTIIGDWSATRSLIVSASQFNVSLQWNEMADFDLHLWEPSGNHIYYANKVSSTGGFLNADSNSCYGGAPQETIAWPGAAPSGTYTINLMHYPSCTLSTVTYTLTIRVRGQATRTVTGSLLPDTQSSNITISLPTGTLTRALTTESYTINTAELPSKDNQPSVAPVDESNTPPDNTSANLPVVPITSLPVAPAIPQAIAPPPAEPPVRLLARALLNGGDVEQWQIGGGWSVVPSDGGGALSGATNEPALRTNGVFFNAAAQARFNLMSGTARLSLRASTVSSYTAEMNANGIITLLRGNTALGSALVNTPTQAGWHTLRLSAIQGTLRVAVDNVEMIVALDPAPLPPGSAQITLGAVGTTADGTSVYAPALVDDFFLFVPESEFGQYPQTVAPPANQSPERPVSPHRWNRPMWTATR
jgi:subtilisin family serine protease